jgi:hypothetical protein
MEQVLSVDEDFLKRLKLVLNAYDKKEELLVTIWHLTRIRDCKIKKASREFEKTSEDEPWQLKTQ